MLENVMNFLTTNKLTKTEDDFAKQLKKFLTICENFRSYRPTFSVY